MVNQEMRKHFAILLSAFTLFASCSTRYYLVRHAERLNDTVNSPISLAGDVRAGILRDSLLPKHISQIFASTMLRTQQTAQPLATALGLELTLCRPDTTAGLLARLKAIRNKNVLVVGHSNTIPALLEGLCGERVSIPENDYDNLYIVTVSRAWGRAQATCAKTTYGPPSPQH